MSKIPTALFAILICMAVVVVALSSIAEVPGSQGFDHRDYPKNTIQQNTSQRNLGQSGPTRETANGWVTIGASCFGALTCLLVVGGMTLGISPQQRSGFVAWVLTFAAVVFASLFLLVVFLDSGADNSTARLGGLPVSTAVMLVLFAPSPLVLVLLYMVAFRRWILPPEAEARFHRLVAERQGRENR